MSPPVAQFTTPRVRRLAEQVMEGSKPLGSDARLELDRTISASQQDREAYNTLASFFGALESEPPALNQGQREGILAALQREVSTAARPTTQSRALGWLRPLAPAFGVLLVGFLVAIALRPSSNELAWTFQHRGSTAVGQEGMLGLKAYCVRQGKLLPAPPLSAGITLAGRCMLSDELQLALTHTAGFSHLLVIGDLVDTQSGEHTLTWYHPAPPTGRSGRAPMDAIDAVLGQARRLNVNHKPGALRVVAVFSRAPLTADAIHATLRGLDRAAPAGPALERIDDQGRVEVTAVDLHVKIEGGAP